ncbi:DUF982 domain-containing protein [Phyllobacterium sp. OV277]|uniref:DUF982 domain-containing protein n=1 Tax=Phyllobacterium sp. OV277 TaxID=1882772 RepID=UPI0008807470|nr:DUF982 domain-containing protein [Phyllobacterium sp. OV277]SDP66382.1 Protein of unknown function [Phyllobacterium sp. OV277]
MHKHPFESVTVETKKASQHRNITSVEEAAEFLLYDWPKREGPTYLAAQQTCLDALQEERSVNEAREAFITAAKAAYIFIKEGR